MVINNHASSSGTYINFYTTEKHTTIALTKCVQMSRQLPPPCPIARLLVHVFHYYAHATSIPLSSTMCVIMSSTCLHMVTLCCSTPSSSMDSSGVWSVLRAATVMPHTLYGSCSTPTCTTPRRQDTSRGVGSISTLEECSLGYIYGKC